MTLRALFFVSDLLGGGAQRTLLNLAAAMPRDSCQVELAIGGPDGPARRWIEPSLPVHDLGSDRLRRAVWPLARLIRARRPDIVLATMVDANVAAYAALRLAGVRSALALRETNSQRARGDIGAVRRWLSRFAYRRADLVIALSEGVRRELIADFALDPARTVTIGNPVNVAATAAAAADARARAAPWAARWSDPTVVAIGRLHRQKGFDILLAALADHTPPHARLVILGDGGDRAALEAEARRRGLVERVWFAGFVADPVPFLAHA
ncbi:MAG: glycosyltransferase, partial [Alphaproteobacteria bacterium]